MTQLKLIEMPEEVRVNYNSKEQYIDFETKACDFFRSLGYVLWGGIPTNQDGGFVLIFTKKGTCGHC